MTISAFDDTVVYKAGGSANRTADLVVAVNRDGTVIGSAVPTNSKATTFTDLPDVALNNNSTTVIEAADATRREMILTSNPTNTAVIRIGAPATVSASRGAALSPGQTMVLTTTAAVNAFAAVASQVVSVSLVKD